MKKSKYFKWIAWGLPVLAYVICFFHSLSMGVIRSDLMNDFGLSDTGYATISSAYFYIYLIMQIPSGILVDTVGPRKTVAYGTGIAAAGTLLFGLTNIVAGLFLGRLLIGLGVSVIFVSIIKIQSQWFDESKFGTMSGLTCFIGTMGGVVAQTPLALLVGLLTWRLSFITIAGFSAAVALLVFIFVRDKPEDLSGHNEDEEEIAKVSFKDVWRSLIQIFKNKKTWPAFLIYAGFYGTFVVISGFWGTAYMNEVYDISLTAGSKYIAMVVLGSAIGAMLIGWMSDKMKSRKKPVIIYSFAYVLMWASLVFLKGGRPPINIMMVLLFALGFFSQGFVLSWAVGKEVNNPKNVGMTASVINMGGFLGSIAITPIIANILDKYGDILTKQELYQKAFSVAFIVSVLTFICSLFVTETGCKSIYMKDSVENVSEENAV